jgi:hypothetical protein
MNDSLYTLKCSNRNYFVRYTVILITSRDFAILSLCRCLRHSHTEHELRAIFHHLNSLKSDWNVSDCIFWKFSYKRKFSFLLIFCTRNRHSTVIESYIKRNDVIRYELDLTFIEKLIHYLRFTNDCREKRWLNSLRLLSRKRFIERIFIKSLERREIERICLWLMMLSIHSLSFDLWTRKLNWCTLRSFSLWWSEFECRCALFLREIENFWSKQ